MGLDEQIDEGSPVGGSALALGLGALGLAVVQLPAAAVGIGWIPGCLAWVAAPLAVLLGALSLVMEESPRGRRNAKRGLGLGVAALVVQLVVVGVALYVFDQRFDAVFQSVSP